MQDPNRYTSEAAAVLAEIARRIDAWPAELRAFEYDYESFGCWRLVLRHKGQRTRFMYDGKDGYLAAERLQRDAGDFTKPPVPLAGIDARADLNSPNIDRIVDFLRKHTVG